jgi:molybdopterin synthase sulfur carrier subunit
MSVQVFIPTVFRSQTGDQAVLALEATSIGQLLATLRETYSGLGEKLFRTSSALELNRFINIYVNGEDIRFLDGFTTLLKDGDEVSLVPAIAGGSAGGHESL